MAPAGAALAVAAAVCFLLVAPAPASRPANLPPPQVLPDAAIDREAAAEKLLLLPKPVESEADLTTTTALAVPEEEEERGQLSSLLCLVFRCDGDGDVNTVAVRRSGGDSQDGEWWPEPARKGKGGDEAEADGDSDSDSDCDSDSDDEEEDEGSGIVGWFWSLAHRF